MFTNFSLIATFVVAVPAIPAGMVFVRKLARIQRAVDGMNAAVAQLPPLRRDGGAR